MNSSKSIKLSNLYCEKRVRLIVGAINLLSIFAKNGQSNLVLVLVP